MELIRHDDGTCVLTMDEGKANAMSPAFLAAMDEALDSIEASAPRGVVLTGAGRHFCAGLDLAGLDALPRADMDAFVCAFERTLLRWFRLSIPVVAAVNGNAIAGGCVLAACADHRVAATGEYWVGLNEVRLNVSLPSVALEAPRLLLSPRAFRTAALEGDLVRPDRALELGMVDELVLSGDLPSAASAALERLCRSPGPAFAVVKREVRREADRSIERDGATARARFVELWFSDEARRCRREVLAR